MGRLPNHLWRRAVELFLLAGREGNDGALPPVEEMAWILRQSADKVLEDLQGLAEIGVVHACDRSAGTSEAKPGKWMVTNFVKRQRAIPDEERSRKYRERVAGATKNATEGHRGVTKNATERYGTWNEAEAGASASPPASDSESLRRRDRAGKLRVARLACVMRSRPTCRAPRWKPCCTRTCAYLRR